MILEILKREEIVLMYYLTKAEKSVKLFTDIIVLKTNEKMSCVKMFSRQYTVQSKHLTVQSRQYTVQSSQYTVHNTEYKPVLGSVLSVF